MRISRAALTLVLALAGCALRPPPSQPEILASALPAETVIPHEWIADRYPGAVTNDWLSAFNDPVLDAILAEALANNLDLLQAADKVEVARQMVTVVGAKLLPQIGGKIAGKRTHDFGDEDYIKHTHSHTVAALNIAWEMDVWGRLRSQRAAAEAEYDAGVFEYAYAQQSLAATVALNWYLTTETYQLLQLAERAVEIYAGLLQLAEIRRDSGKSTDLDVVDARARMETAMSELQSARIDFDRARRTLEVLLGRYPAAEIQAAPHYPPLPPPVAAGLPATLLERRPDILAAEYRVLAAFRKREAVRLALLPDFSLSLTAERLGDHLLEVLHLSPYRASVEMGATVPIYEGGALCAYLNIATAEQAQAVAHYGSVVLNAFREVENAIASEALLARQLEYAQRALADRTRAVEIARVQYRAGRRDLLWVEELQAGQIAAEAKVIQLRNARIANRIRLHLALGGSFGGGLAAPGGLSK
ncbi:RND transporter [Microbulbifer thermotolerans]|uniref:RND transporter n=1 Tax=Microbulbifer thermotolerans TaxID=252514 RepID=A0A143HLU9_MICTH|nr:efflux transporter outer membrane subunit [Microbulbifer thermotolerans]AMX02466.1 RND transporter [Microbulbifer thermotolerans]MCX2795064.1 efflux transporter outer membrane subunit [Microbulbifer thermotolerans]